MYSVLSNCEVCLHNKICNNKNFYADAQKRVRELYFAKEDNGVIDVCHSDGVQVTVQCPHYLIGNQPTFRNSISAKDYVLCSDALMKESDDAVNVTLRG